MHPQVYDITKTCDGPLCYDMSAADEFLNRPDVREALGVGDREWSECNFDVHGDMMGGVGAGTGVEGRLVGAWGTCSGGRRVVFAAAALGAGRSWYGEGLPRIRVP